MTEERPYKCVNCGEPVAALYKSYGPSVLKLTNCDKCNGIVDKYVEYDPVIVMIDLVLMSREAQRHVIYNTEFKVYWKLFIILAMLETYAAWRGDSLLSIGVDVLCNENRTQDSAAYLNALELSSGWKSNCAAWTTPARTDDTNLFIWEKDFYIQFISTFSGIVAFIATIYTTMGIWLHLSRRKQVPFETLLKAYSLAATHTVFVLPTLVWGEASGRETRALHHILVSLYGAVTMYNVFTVVYGSGRAVAGPLAAACVARLAAVLY